MLWIVKTLAVRWNHGCSRYSEASMAGMIPVCQSLAWITSGCRSSAAAPLRGRPVRNTGTARRCRCSRALFEIQPRPSKYLGWSISRTCTSLPGFSSNGFHLDPLVAQWDGQLPDHLAASSGLVILR